MKIDEGDGSRQYLHHESLSEIKGEKVDTTARRTSW
jgi:hypothetical protein